MTCFFTSSPMVPDTEDLNPANGFIHRLHLAVPYPCRALYVCSDPDDWEKTDLYAEGTAEAMERAGFAFTEFEVLDGRNAENAAALIKNADFKYIFLSYNNEGLMSCETIERIMKKYGKYKLFIQDHRRYKADNAREAKADKTVEYLHCLIKK